MAKFIPEFWSGVFGGWNPSWYLGYPLYLLYTPLLLFLEVAMHQIIPTISVARAYRLITAFSYCLVPVSLYIFVLRISKNRIAAFITALSFSILPSFNYVIGEVKAVGNSFAFAPWRLVILTLYGEGPHTIAQVFLLLSAAAYHKLLEKRSFFLTPITALLVAVTGLTNAIGFFALVILLLIIAFVELLMEEDQEVRSEKLRVSVNTALAAYGLMAFWYNFSFIKNFFGEGEGVLGNYFALFPWGIVFLLLLAGLIYYALSRVRNRVFRIPLLWFGMTFFIVGAHYKWGIDYAPQALRLMAEVDMAASTLLGLIIGYLVSVSNKKKITRLFVSPLVIIVAIGLIVFVSRQFLGLEVENGQVAFRIPKPYSHVITAPGTKLEESAEYEVGQWADDNVKEGRIYLTGNYAFWLNYFSDVPQVRGALDQSVIHPWVMHASYQIYHGESGEISEAWAKIMNVEYIVVNTPSSRNPFKDYLYPAKFEGLLEPVFREQGDIIYKVPLKDTGLAKTVNLPDHSQLTVPRNAIDKESILGYVEWLEKGKALSFNEIDNGYGRIEGNLDEGEGVLVQVSYHDGWKAYQNGQRVTVRPDVLGFLLIEPMKTGEVVIELKYGRVFWQYLGYAVTFFTVVYFLYKFMLATKLGRAKKA